MARSSQSDIECRPDWELLNVLCFYILGLAIADQMQYVTQNAKTSQVP